MKRYSGIILLALLIAAAFAPIKVPYTLESVAKVLPARQWILTRGADGALTVTLHDHRSGLLEEAEGYQFDRGDLVQMEFNAADSLRHFAREGEILAAITSNRLEEQLTALKNQLRVEKANLGVVSTGEKQELIRQLTEEVRLAEENLKLQKKMYDRGKVLYEEGVIALSEFEQVENAHDAAILAVRVAREALEVGNTGEKVETVTLANEQIEALQQQIAFFEDKQRRYLLHAPFDGSVRSEITLEGDRILLEDTAASILLIPLRLKDARYVEAGQEIVVKLPDREQEFASSVLNVGAQVQLLGSEQVVVVKALTREKELPGGVPMRCRIDCGKVRISEFLKRSVQW
jgi:hypothetical protein